MDIKQLGSGKNPPGEIMVMIEVPMGSSVKYEFDKDSGVVMVDRFLYTAMHFPCNYGFIPNTLEDDGDPVDVLVLSPQPVQAGTAIAARPVGMLETEDESGMDAKIIAVPLTKLDPWHAHIQDIGDVPEPTKAMIKHFYEHMKELEPGKWVKVKGFKGAAEAMEKIKNSIKN